MFIDFYRNNAPDSNDASLYRSMLNLLSDSQLYVNYQNLLKNYVGQYYCYRLSGKSDFPIVEGNVEIFEDIALNLFRFEHKYEYFPSDGAVPINFIHRGPVFLQSDRLYLIGIGRDDDANYMRPIILKSVDDPARKALVGLLMTESVNQVPFSCKTLFISVALKNTLVNRFGDDDKFVQFVVKKLTVNALSKDIIFGWSEQTERLGETA